jgi:hypothetical protein
VAELVKDDAIALATGGLALACVTGDLEGGVALIDRALALNPNLTTAWYEIQAGGDKRHHGAWRYDTPLTEE